MSLTFYGPTGPQGNDGIQGPQGLQGIRGPTGLQGQQGIQGPAGDGWRWATYVATQSVDLCGNGVNNITTATFVRTGALVGTITSDASSSLVMTAPNGIKANTPLYSRMPITEVSGTTLTIASANYNTYFYITNSGFNELILPASTVTTDAGSFWSLKNATSSSLSITLTNNLTVTSPLVISPSNVTTLAISGVTANTILLF